MAVTWTPNAEPDVAGYHIYYGPTNGLYTNRVTVDATANIAHVEPLRPGGRYYLAMTAFNMAGIESLKTQDLIYDAPNKVPTISAISDQQLLEDVPSAPVYFIVGDAESPASALTVKARSSNPRVIPDEYVLLGGSGAQRNLLLVPQLEQSGNARITIEVRDPHGGSNSVSFNVVIDPLNDAPVISPIPNQTINEDGVSARLPFYIFDAESPPDDLLLIPIPSDEAIIPYDSIIFTGIGNSRALTFKPAKDASGSCTIELYVMDPEGAYSSTSFSVIIRPINDPPTVRPVPPVVVDEDASSPVIQLTVTDPDNPLTDLKLSGSSSNPSLVDSNSFTFGGIGSNRTMVIRPKPDQFGTCIGRVIASDSGGAFSTNIFVITVNPINDMPTIDPLPSFTVYEGSGLLTVQLRGITSGAPNELQPLFVTASSTAPNVVAAPVVDYISPHSSGSLLISALPNVAGSAVITVAVSDGQATNTRSFTITVQAVNDPPTLSGLPDIAVLRVPTPLQITFSVHDLDTPVDRLTVNGYALDPILLPASNVVITGTGPNRTVTVYPAFGRVGSTTITLVVSDGESTVSASFYILVTAAIP